MRRRRVASFDRAVAANRDALFAYFGRRLSNPADAADAFGETLLIAWRIHRGMPDGEADARMWFYGIARNVLRNTQRTLARRSEAVRLLRDHVEATRTDEAEPHVRQVRAAIDELPIDDAELIRLTYWDGLPSHEAAVVLGLNPSTARSRLSRLRTTLRATLEATARDDARHV